MTTSVSDDRKRAETMTTLTTAERLKFQLLSEGITLSAGAREFIDQANTTRPMTPADYASTSGVILVLEDDVWVNAPIADHNPNFVAQSAFMLCLDGDRLVVRSAEVTVPARCWLPPLYHGESNRWGEPFNSYAFTHADRVRISPIEGCSMACRFCDLPYEFRYRTKRVEGLVDAVLRAAVDPIQPAHHVLISGGTPRTSDFGYVRSVYETVIRRFRNRDQNRADPHGATPDPFLPVDVMMVPLDGLLDATWLLGLGVSELSVNIEIFNRDLAHRLIRRKADQGLDHYLQFLEHAAGILPPGRVRSMLMVGLEPVEDTLAGVDALARRGCVPVLSPFRPDPSTPLAGHPSPGADLLEEVYLRAHDIVTRHDIALGPSCVPCTHNTLTLASTGHGDAHIYHGVPALI